MSGWLVKVIHGSSNRFHTKFGVINDLLGIPTLEQYYTKHNVLMAKHGFGLEKIKLSSKLPIQVVNEKCSILS